MISDGNGVPLLVQAEMLNFQILGGSVSPTITGADITTGTIFDGNNWGQYYPGVNQAGTLAVVGTDTVTGSVSPSGLLATLTLMVGTTPGEFSMAMLGTPEGNSFFSYGATPYTPAFPHGRFTVGNPDRHWTKDGGGAWDTDLNWSPFAPYTVGDQANFLGAVSSGTATVTLDGVRTAGSVTFNNTAASYNILANSGTSNLRMDNGLSAPTITNLGGNHAINAPVSLAMSTNVSVAAGSVLTLGGTVSGASSNLNLNGGGSLVLSGNNAYAGTNIGAGSTLYVGNGAANGTMGSGAVSNNGTLVIDRAGTATFGNAISGTGGVSLVGSATVTFAGASNYSGQTVIANGTLRLNGATSHTIGSVVGGGALQVDTGSSLVSRDVNVASVALVGTASHAIAPGSSYSKVFTLSLDHSGTGTAATYTSRLELNNNRLVVEAENSLDKSNKILSLNEAIFAGRNSGGAGGIVSSTVAGDPTLTIGVFDNGMLGKSNYAGGVGNVDSNSILVSPALLGDANLDGIVNFNDMIAVTSNWNTHGLSNGISTIDMAHGDLNSDGIVNFNDMIVVTSNWNHSSATFNLTALMEGENEGGFGLSPASVPEPASIAVLAAGTTALLCGRRRRQR
jgi:autotransporter-associated beta strand protein